MNLYEHFYPRLVYNGQIYDDGADQVGWASRALIRVKLIAIRRRWTGPQDFGISWATSQ